MNRVSRTISFFALLLAAATAAGQAAYFTPTEAEWATWPAYCQARYISIPMGQNSVYAGRLSDSAVATQSAQIGEKAWYWLHHFCFALVYIDRARTADDVTARHLLGNAEEEFSGQYQRVPSSDAFFPEMVTHMARLHRERNEPDKALSLLEQGMAASPTYSSTYAYASMILRDLNRVQDAKSVLLQGDEATDGMSAEIKYFLGLICIETGELDAAQKHAARAYELGYPLPGLRMRLEKLGRSLD